MSAQKVKLKKRANQNDFGALGRTFTKCLSRSLNLAPPKPEPEVNDLLDELGLTSQHVHQMYATFRRLRSGESLLSKSQPNEVQTTSVAKLVRTQRRWVTKILLSLLKLAGFYTAVTWDGFLYTLLQFCTLSKLELSQTMYFIVAMEMRTWTVHSITAAQLEDFYQEFSACPAEAFDTGPIDFAKLPLAKYTLIDFVELTYRFSQLVNPCLHLQRELQRAMPGMDYWLNYDIVKMRNRKLGMDFFRHKKMLSLVDAVRMSHSSEARASKAASHLPTSPTVAEAPKPRDTSRKTPASFMPIPISPHRSWRASAKQEAHNPEWMEEHLGQNFDPLRGTALGSAAEAASTPDIAPSLPEGWVAVEDPERPKRLYYWNRATNEVSWQPPPLPPQTVEEAKAAVLATVGERSRRTAGLGDGLVNKPHARDEYTRNNAIIRTKELDFVREARKREAAVQQKKEGVSLLEKAQAALVQVKRQPGGGGGGAGGR